MNDCLFCKIVKGEIPSYTVYEDEKVKVFLDINPNMALDILLTVDQTKFFVVFSNLDIIKPLLLIYQFHFSLKEILIYIHPSYYLNVLLFSVHYHKPI